ncbi:MAG: hypothetical protein ACREEM_29975 [Blastocatellia bacterium]
MQNIFIAVGGSGAKVAEALVRLLAIGFPTRLEANGTPTSAGDGLQIWRLDPDRSSGAAQALQKAVDEYGFLLDNLRKGDSQNRWAMEIERDDKNRPRVRHLDPLSLHEENQQVKTLRGILHSQGRALNGQPAQDSTPLLSLFYEQKELDVEIDRGFYQKPFIGAPVMAIFAETLKDGNSAGGRQCQFSYLEAQAVRFFLCGSLHGGTGACGLPVMGKFLGEYKKAKQHLDWQLGGCLLAPYCLPPDPPIEQLQEAQRLAGAQNHLSIRAVIDDYVRRYGHVAPFNRMANTEAKRELVKQILLGFYAQRTDMTDRARHSLVYYKDHIAPYFNALYLIGKPYPDQLPEWSNGGETQLNPLNSAEVAAALSALNFFAGAHDQEHQAQSYVLASSTRNLGDQMLLGDLPQYSLPSRSGPVKIDPERVFLATAAMRHLIAHQLPWQTESQDWPPELKGLKTYYQTYPDNEAEDKLCYPNALRVIADSIHELLHQEKSLGWNGKDYEQLSLLLSDDETEVATITEKMQTSWWGKEAEGSIAAGGSEVRVSKKEFPEWRPEGNEFTRGDYLRCVWQNLLARSVAPANS